MVSSAVVLFLVMTVYVCQKKKKIKDHNIGKYLGFTGFSLNAACIYGCTCIIDGLLLVS